MTRVIPARFNMTADLYTKATTRNADTGQLEATWTFDQTIDCEVRGVVSQGIRTVGSTEGFRRAESGYFETDWIKIRGAVLVSKRARVTNVKDRYGNVLWFDPDLDAPMRFEVLGSQPMPDPLGRVYLYETLCERVQDGLDEQWVMA